MSTSAFSGSYAGRERLRASSVPTRPQGAAELLTHHRASEWVGTLGEQVRLRGHVIALTSTTNRVTYLVRCDETDDLVEWSTQRRHGIVVGDHLALSGLVKAHVTRDGTCVTVLRDCFNPLRMA